MLDQSRGDIRNRLADVALRAPDICGGVPDGGAGGGAARTPRAVDLDGRRRKRLDAPGTLVSAAIAAVIQAVLERYERDPATGRRNAKPIGPVEGSAPPMTLDAGLVSPGAGGPGLARVSSTRSRWPRSASRRRPDATARRRRSRMASSTFRPASSGSGTPTSSCGRSFSIRCRSIAAGPARTWSRSTRRPIGEWIAFLGALPPAERAKQRAACVVGTRSARLAASSTTGAGRGSSNFSRRRSGTARAPAACVLRRAQAARAPGLVAFPVAGVSRGRCERYFAWLRETGRVPGARLCTELEWERAARGAMIGLPARRRARARRREIDVTYGRIDSAYGPDTVGYTRLRAARLTSMIWRAMCWSSCIVADKPGEIVIRGGALLLQSRIKSAAPTGSRCRRRFAT